MADCGSTDLLFGSDSVDALRFGSLSADAAYWGDVQVFPAVPWDGPDRSGLAHYYSIDPCFVTLHDNSVVKWVSNRGYETWKMSGSEFASPEPGPSIATAELNGRDVLLFDENIAYHNIQSVGFPYTIVIVAKLDPQSSKSSLWFSGNSNVGANFEYNSADSKFTLSTRTTSPMITTGAIANNYTWKTYFATLNGANSQIQINSTIAATGDIGAENHALGGSRYGIGLGLVGTQKSWMAELMIYDKVLSAPEKTAILSFINGKYGI